MAEIHAKICLLGDPAVGKTSLIRRFVFDEFNDDYIVTIGTKVTKKVLNLPEGRITFMIWDILGQKSMTVSNVYYRGAMGAIFVADITNIKTIKSFGRWYREFSAVRGDVPVIVVLNKCDLEPAYDTDKAREIISEYGDFQVYTSSARTGENVNEVFEKLASAVYLKLKKVIDYEQG